MIQLRAALRRAENQNQFKKPDALRLSERRMYNDDTQRGCRAGGKGPG